MARLPKRNMISDRFKQAPKPLRIGADGAEATIRRNFVSGAFGGVKLGVKGAMWTLTVSQLLDLLGFLAPEKLEQLYQLAEDYGIPLEELKTTTDQATLQLLMGLAAQVGFTPEELEQVGINAKDIANYAKVFARYGLKHRDKHDEAQVSISDEDDSEDSMRRMKSIAYACERLMMTGPNRARQLYHVALVINSIKDEHVLEFENHERTWGKIPSTGITVL